MTRMSQEEYDNMMECRGVKPSAPAVELEIPGAIQGKDRPRFYKGHAVTTEKTSNYETLVKWIYREKYKDLMLEGPLTVSLKIVYSIPKSTSKKNKAAMLDGLILPTKKPDIDNVEKVIYDSLNGICYHDDSQIVETHCIKYYGEVPKVVIKINKFDIQLKFER